MNAWSQTSQRHRRRQSKGVNEKLTLRLKWMSSLTESEMSKQQRRRGKSSPTRLPQTISCISFTGSPNDMYLHSYFLSMQTSCTQLTFSSKREFQLFPESMSIKQQFLSRRQTLCWCFQRKELFFSFQQMMSCMHEYKMSDDKDVKIFYKLTATSRVSEVVKQRRCVFWAGFEHNGK